MLTLLIDTHYDIITLIIYQDGHILACQEYPSSYQHSRIVLPAIDKLLTAQKVSVQDLNEIIVVNGPGSFTGVRIGVTIAKTLAYTMNIPIKPVSSLFVKACNLKGIKTVGIREKNGLFGAKYDQDNQLLVKPFYLSNEKISEYSEKIIENVKIDYEVVYQACSNIEPVNPHQIKPLYVKTIEVLNG